MALLGNPIEDPRLADAESDVQDIIAADRSNVARGEAAAAVFEVLIFPTKWESACASQLRIRVKWIM
jgi:hypothetical protein